jgi:2-polyprenyl-3-methyl-5-hydroxy-6-metoxy-1,4-benzoquinol methylase
MNDWENYWKDIHETGTNGQVFWDSIAERASLEDLGRFKDHLDSELPLLDLGCGNGRQTRFLAQYFKKVIGVDVSPSAIHLAKQETIEESNIEYRVFDAVDTKSAQALHDEFGDLNIYMRGVLHMIKRGDRSKFVDSLAILLGERGVLYQIELPSKAILYLRTLPQEVFSRIPKITRRIGFNLEERESYYPKEKWTIVDQGQQVTINTSVLSNGETGAVPANYLILKRKMVPT